MADINLTAEQVAALILSIGDKSKLKTEEKQTLVDAINNVLDMRVNPAAVPLYIRGTYDAQANTFTPDTDYTVQEINDAFMAGRYVAVVVNEYIVPLVAIDGNYASFDLNDSDPRDLSSYVYINVIRNLNGWRIVFDEN